MKTDKVVSRLSGEQKYAIVLLVKEIMSQLDETASLLSQGYSANISKMMFREMCSVLRELEPDLRDYYFEILPRLAGRDSVNHRAKFSQEYAESVVYRKRDFLMRIRDQLKSVSNF